MECGCHMESYSGDTLHEAQVAQQSCVDRMLVTRWLANYWTYLVTCVVVGVVTGVCGVGGFGAGGCDVSGHSVTIISPSWS